MTEKNIKEELNTNHMFSYAQYIIWPSLWVFYFLLVINFDFNFALVQASVFVCSQFMLVFINKRMLLPRYYKEEDSTKHILIGLLIISCISLFSTTIDWWFIHDHTDLPRGKPDRGVTGLIFPYFMHVVVNGLVFFVSTSIALNEKTQAKTLRIKELERAQTDTELRFLKTQINPHFLFNALNNIYTISYMGEKEAPDKILELSEMLRYVLYDCKGNKVSIEKEIAYIRNYIDFQQLKTEKNQNIKLQVEGIKSDTTLAPMLLIPFIENSFKHSKIDKEKDAFVEINILQKDNLKITFRNSIPAVKPTKWLNSEGGIGLENVRKRLELLYQNDFSLTINEDNGVFNAELIINNLKQAGK